MDCAVKKMATKPVIMTRAGHDGVPVAVALGYPTVDEQAKDLAHIGSVAEAGLPGRRDLVLAW